MTDNIPFQQVLKLVKMLTPDQKAIVKKELAEESATNISEKDDFINFLLNGPVYSEEDIAIIEENRKSIATWRTEK